MGRNQRDEPIVDFTITNRTTDTDISCDGAVAEIGDGLGTLIDKLQSMGLIGGSTS